MSFHSIYNYGTTFYFTIDFNKVHTYERLIFLNMHLICTDYTKKLMIFSYTFTVYKSITGCKNAQRLTVNEF